MSHQPQLSRNRHTRPLYVSKHGAAAVDHASLVASSLPDILFNRKRPQIGPLPGAYYFVPSTEALRRDCDAANSL